MKKIKLPIQEGLEIKIRVENGFLVTEYSEEQKFKDGDFVCFESEATLWVFILKSVVGNNKGINIYSLFSSTTHIVYYGDIVSLNYLNLCHLATEEEKQRLLDAMHKDGKDWDAVNRKVVDYVEPLKEGDLAILWNDDIASSCVKEIIRIIPRDDKSYLYGTEECAYENAIKCYSLEQYLKFIK